MQAGATQTRPAGATVGAFGEKLRQQREKRGLTIEAISNVTKISPRMLLALEEERFEQLPGGVFNKGFVRAYARQVGLSEEEALTGYLAALGESQVQSQPILPDFRKSGHAAPIAALDAASAPFNPAPYEQPDSIDADDSESSPGSRFLDDLSDRRKGERRRSDRREPSPHHSGQPEASHDSGFSGPAVAAPPVHQDIRTDARTPAPAISRGRKLVAAILLVSAGLGGWILHRHYQSPERLAIPGVASSTPAVTATASSTPPTIGQPQPAIPKPSPTAPPKIFHSTPPATTEESDSTSSKTLPASQDFASKPPAASAVAPPSSATPPSAIPRQVAVKPPATFTLTIRAEKTTWVSITSDGNPVAHETLIAPAHTSVRATSQIVVKAGNAAGVSFLLNGKEVPSTGNDGEVRTYTFNSTGLTGNSQTMPAANR